MRTLAGLLFIAAVGGLALYLAQRETVADGSVLAAQLLGASTNVAKLDCDREVPIGRDGAVFRCTARMHDGSTALYEITMNRKGDLLPRALSTTGTTVAPPVADPWAN